VKTSEMGRLADLIAARVVRLLEESGRIPPAGVSSCKEDTWHSDEAGPEYSGPTRTSAAASGGLSSSTEMESEMLRRIRQKKQGEEEARKARRQLEREAVGERTVEKAIDDYEIHMREKGNKAGSVATTAFRLRRFFGERDLARPIRLQTAARCQAALQGAPPARPGARRPQGQDPGRRYPP
jgi:hypothetical protein